MIIGPFPERAVCLADPHNLFKSLFIPGLPGKFTQVFNQPVDLLPDIADSGLGHIIVGIITGINEKDWNIHLSCKVFIPFGELVADIIGQEQEIRLHHFSSVGQRNAAFSV